MFRNRSVDAHAFAMVPRAEIPRSRFNMQTAHKTTFDAGYLIPVFCTEVLPGDSFRLSMTAFARMATPIFPIMDNLYMDSFFFFVPNRIVWTNWVKMMGEQTSPGDSISYSTPQIVSPSGGFGLNTIYDYFGLPTSGQVLPGNTISVSALPLRAYAKIYDEWFRDENLCTPFNITYSSDGPDPQATYVLKRRGKRFDYFTSCLPFLQKGTAVALPLSGNAPVKTGTIDLVSGAQQPVHFNLTTGGATAGGKALATIGGLNSNLVESGLAATLTGAAAIYPTNLFADLSAVTATTINQLRLAFQTQKLLERDARGGTRYTELVRSHFGVISPDARLQRPEYLGGGTSPVTITPVAQTSNTPVSGTPQGNLAAFGTMVAQGHGFSQSFTEHGHIIGLVCIRADLTYQQGLRRMWSRLTRYDYYWPVFAALGEQAVLNKEIYADGSANDALTFGYNERWAEYRYHPAMITGLFRSTSAGTLDGWHLSQKFAGLPALNEGFIQEAPPVDRVLAVTSQTGKQFIFDSFFNIQAARPLPMYSVPGLIDHF